jgi:ABC-2 type transport system ATP-binding protein
VWLPPSVGPCSSSTTSNSGRAVASRQAARLPASPPPTMTTSAATSSERITQDPVTRRHYTAQVPVSATSAVPVALAVREATRRLGGRTVLDAVDVTVPRGAAVALVGANGAGKTSLMRAIGGRLRLERGAIDIDGQPAPAARRAGRLGVVPQALALYPHLTVQENLAVLGRLAGVARRDVAARVDDALASTGLGDRAASLVQSLSGGMQRRVHLIAAILHQPALVLLDEPTVGVDAASRERLHDSLRALRDRGTGMLLATHDLDEAAAVCDAVVVLAGGRVVAAGSVAELLARAFDSARELVVTVAPPVPSGVLEAEGFVVAAGDDWVRPLHEDADGLGALERRLTAAGVVVAALHLRRPTLAGAVARLVARASAAEPS